jgi:hypothetical protein
MFTQKGIASPPFLAGINLHCLTVSKNKKRIKGIKQRCRIEESVAAIFIL